MEDIFGMFYFLEGNSTVPENNSALVLGMYALWYLQCPMASKIYYLDSQCGSHDDLSFGLLWITNLLPGGDSGVQL